MEKLQILAFVATSKKLSAALTVAFGLVGAPLEEKMCSPVQKPAKKLPLDREALTHDLF